MSREPGAVALTPRVRTPRVRAPRVHTPPVCRSGWRLLAVATVALVLAVVALPTASAHNGLVSTVPATGAALDRTPAAIVLTFDEPAIALGTQIVVTGPTGRMNAGAPELLDSTVSQPLLPGAPAGRYTVDWRVTSADGHPITGQFAFTSAGAAPGTLPTESAVPIAPADPAASTTSPLLGLTALLVVAGAAVVIVGNVRRRRLPPAD